MDYQALAQHSVEYAEDRGKSVKEAAKEIAEQAGADPEKVINRATSMVDR